MGPLCSSRCRQGLHCHPRSPAAQPGPGRRPVAAGVPAGFALGARRGTLEEDPGRPAGPAVAGRPGRRKCRSRGAARALSGENPRRIGRESARAGLWRESSGGNRR